MDKVQQRLTDLSAVQLALLAQRLRRDSKELGILNAEPVAVIGIGCRFPGGAANPRRFWDLLRDGVDAITEVPAERWDADAVAVGVPDAVDRGAIRWGGFVAGVDLFDAAFFRISPREATHMDPQQRLFLEVAWEALEHAGQPVASLAGSRTGIYAGISNADYLWRQGGLLSDIELYHASGVSNTFLANRLSYLLDLRGPSLTLDTACSSSLVAVHLACQSLRGGECDLALAGGVNLILSPFYHLAFSTGQVLAPDGRCKTFDERADGYVRGEGAGVVVLKRLSDALADEDRIMALIRGSAVNQDGLVSGLGAPNGLAQRAVIRGALASAGVSPDRVAYVEAHGTGTPLGDPIEIEAVVEGYRLAERRSQALVIGSVKTNVGHLEAAAGVAGLVKVILAVGHGLIPPHLNFEKLNPYIDFAGNPFLIPTALMPWPEGAQRRLAGISSFGAGGTNAHVILEEPPTAPAAPEEELAGPYLLPISARTSEALGELAGAYRREVADGSGMAPRLSDLTYTAGVRRTHHPHRLSVVGHSHEQLAERLEDYLRGTDTAGITSGRADPDERLKIAFVFSGQGAQWLGMGRQLLAREEVFRAAFERCEELLRPHAGWSLRADLEADGKASRLAATAIVQPLLFALQVALTELWSSWGVRPDAVVGHSSGEVAAAWAAGALSLEDAVRVIFHRGRLMDRVAAGGRMASVALSWEEAQRAVAGREERLAVAAHNSPRSTVLSGEAADLEAVLARLREEEIWCRPVRVEYAFHSPRIDPCREQLVEVLAGLEVRSPALPVFSTVTGERAGTGAFDATYWGRNVREPVRFAAAVDALLAEEYDAWVEIAPHPVLSVAISECAAQRRRQVTVVPSLRRDHDERAVMLGSLGALYAVGAPVEWGALSRSGRSISLPTYPWQRQRFWREVEVAPRRSVAGAAVGNQLLGAHQQLAPEGHLFTLRLDSQQPAFLADHRVGGTVVVPGTAYLEMVLAAATRLTGDGSPLGLAEVEYRQALLLSAGESAEMQVLFSPAVDGATPFQIYSRGEDVSAPGGWRLHATGTVLPGVGDPSSLDAAQLEAIRARCPKRIDGEAFYARHRALGNQWGASFQGVAELWQGAGEALARVVVTPALVAEVGSYRFHPAVLDACGHVLPAAVTPDEDAGNEGGLVLGGLDRISVYGPPSPRMWAWATAVEQTASALKGDVHVCDETGRPLVVVEGLCLRYLDALEAAAVSEKLEDWLYELAWEADDPSVAEDLPWEEPGSWLVLSDEGGVGAGLARLLEERGETVIRVARGEGYQRLGTTEYRLDPKAPDAFRRLLAEAFGSDRPRCRGSVHLWSLDLGCEPSAAAQVVGCGSALHLIQGLLAVAPAPRLWLVTCGAQAAGIEGAAVAVAQAPLWGLGRSASREHPELRPTLVDLEPGTAADQVSALWRQICAGDEEDQVAWRDGRRRVARVVRSAAATAAGSALPVRADAAYLITGGLGGIGSLVARWLVEHGARHLILVGRTPLPERAQWDCPQGDRQATAIAHIRELEALGATVHPVAADVADRDRLAGSLDQLRQRGVPAIRGVVHAAGVIRFQPLVELDLAALDAELRPKVAGGWNLHRLFAESPPDFFVLFSSAATLLTWPLVAAYTAANAFLDALAQHRRSAGQPALSIGWGLWEEVGMAAGAGAETGRSPAPHGVRGMTPQQGLEAFARLLGSDAVEVGVVPLDWRQWRRAYPTASRTPLYARMLDRKAAAEAAPDLNRPRVFAAAPGDREPLVAELLAEQVARTLGFTAARLDHRQPLTALGFDSLMAVELRNRVRDQLGVDLPLMTLLAGRSIRELAADLLAQWTAPAPPAARDQATLPAGGVALSCNQQALWIDYQLAPDTAAYNVLFAARIEGAVDVPALRRAFRALVDRHPILRTIYRAPEGQPMQIVQAAQEVSFEAIDAAHWSAEQLDRQMSEHTLRPFVLDRDPVLRIVVFTSSPQQHALLLVLHHIAGDFWSLGILLRELAVLYPAAKAGREPDLPAPGVEYTEFVRWQQDMLSGPVGERLAAYWRRQLADGLPELDLPRDRVRPVPATMRGANHLFLMEADLVCELKALARQQQATVYVTLLAVFLILLRRYTGALDLVVASPMVGRSEGRFREVLGHFVNVVPMRARLAGNPSFRDLLGAVGRTALEALEHQDYPTLLMFWDLLGGREGGRSPRFEVEFAFDAASIDPYRAGLSNPEAGGRWELGGLPLEMIPLPQQAGQYELSFDLIEMGDTIFTVLGYNPDLYDDTTARRLGESFRALLAAAVADPGGGVDELSVLRPAATLELLARPDTPVFSRQNTQEVYVLSPRQRELLARTLTGPETAPVARQMLVTLEGPCDCALLARAASLLVERHPILRTVFHPRRKREPLQLVLKQQRPLAMADHDLRGLVSTARERRLSEWLQEDRRAPWVPTRGPLVRLRHLLLSDRRRWLLWSWHPIILDRHSVRLLSADLVAVHESLRRDQPLPSADFPPYREYLVWLRRQDQEAARRFWQRQLQDVAGPTPLPTDRRPAESVAGSRAAWGRYPLRLPAALGTALAQRARQRELSPETVWQAAWGLLLTRFSGEPEALWGMTVSGRPAELAGGDRMLGPLACTLPLRLQPAADTPLPDLLDVLDQQILDGSHQHYLAAAEIRAASRVTPPQRLCESRVIVRTAPAAGAGPLRPIAEEEPFPRDGDGGLRLEVIPGAAPEIVLHYRPELFDPATASNLGQCFAAMLRSFVETPEAMVAELGMLPAAQRRQLLDEFHRPHPPPSREDRLERLAHQLFEDQAAARPDAVAVVAGEVTVSYGELNRRANQRAHQLRARGVGRDDRVAVISPRGPDLVAMVLAIAKAGAAYLPLDDGNPDERLRAILADSGARLLAVPAALVRRGRELAESLPAAPALWCWGEGASLAGQSTENPPNRTLAHDLANVFYTSGSTGRPKGAMVEQVGMLNHLWGKIDVCGLGAGSAVAFDASIGFDISMWQMLAPLVAGGRVVIYDHETVTDAESFLARIARDRVTVLETVPSLLAIMLPAVDPKLRLPALRYLVSNAETLPVPLARRWLECFPNVQLVNTYGITECSDDVTHQVLSAPPPAAARCTPVGRPIAGFRVYVLDERLRPVAVGCPGQIVMGGIGVGRGYLGDARKTARAFVPDPFAAAPGKRLYLSEDLGRWRPGGELEFLGRCDHQVKVRGHRIELGEVEAALAGFTGVLQAAVAVWPDTAGANRLAAYLVADPGLKLSKLQHDLRRRLPLFMVPEDWLLLESMPLNRHGKIDRRALPHPDQAVRAGVGEEVVTPPRNQLEAQIAGIWQEVLETDAIGVEDDFFAIGGHSLKAIRVRSLIKHQLGIELPLRSIFDYPVLADLARRLRILRDQDRGGETAGIRGIPILPEAEHYALSHAQRRLWFVQQLDPGDVTYNMPDLTVLEGPLDPEIFRRSFAALVRRHPSLHTAFRLVDQEPVQRLEPAATVELDFLDLSELGEQQQDARLRALVAADAGTAFTLAEPPVRARLLRLAADRHMLLLVVHHIITDRWSWDLLRRDLTAFYEAFSAPDRPVPPPLPVRYVDYAAWQNERLRSGELEAAEQYWLQQLGGELPELDLPCDRPRPAVRTSGGGTASLPLDPSLGRRLRQLGEAHGATLFMTLLATAVGFLSRITGQTDIVVGTPVSNRDHVDTEEVVGFFVNMLVVRIVLEDDPTGRQLLERTRATVLDAYAHQQYPFDLLVRRLNPARELNRAPIISVTFAAEIFAGSEVLPERTSSGLLVHPRLVEYEQPMPLDLSMMIWGPEDELRCSVLYARDLFEPATIELLLRRFRLLVEGFAADPESRIADLPWWSDEERAALRLRQLPERELYPLTFPQRDLWFQGQLHPGAPANHLCLPVDLHGRLQVTVLAEAVQAVFDRYVGLWVRFPVVDEQPVQRAGLAGKVDRIEVDLSSLEPGSRKAHLQAWERSLGEMPFDLERGPLSRFGLARLSASEFVLLLVVHHLVIDAMNLVELLDHILEAYLDRRRRPPAGPRIRYSDFAIWLDSRHKAGMLAPHRAYWRRRLAGGPLAFELPGDRPRPAARSFAGGEVVLRLPERRLDELKALRKRLGSSVFRTALAALKLLLGRLTGSCDVVVATPVSIRPPQLAEEIGNFANPLPLRTELEGNPSFAELVKRVDTTVGEAVQHAAYPMGEVFTSLRVEWDRPLLPIGITRATTFHRRSEALTVASRILFNPCNLFDLLVVVEYGKDLKILFFYGSELYDRVTIERLAAGFEALVKSAVSNPEGRFSELGIMTRSERRRILFEFNRNVPRLPRPQSVQRRFEQQAAERPEAVAAVCGRELLTYGELNAEANRIAHWLRSRGLGREDRIGLLGRRGLGMLATILGVLKSGAAFVSLDPGNPDKRLHAILETADLRWIATQASLMPRALEVAREKRSRPGILCWDEAPPELAVADRRTLLAQAHSDLDDRTGPHDLACVFYTSGSTGVPKGAMIEHAGMLNHLAAKIELLELDATSVVIQNASHCFDVCVWQFLAALLVGGRVAVCSDEEARDPLGTLMAAQRHGARVLETVPSFLRAMLEASAERGDVVVDLPQLEFLISNAETLPPALGRQWFERFPHAALVNTYGATECSDDTTHHVMRDPPRQDASLVAVGRSIPGLSHYVLDRYLQPVPVDFPGRIAIAGVGVGRGYLGDPRRSARTFVPDPLATEPGSRCYLTGDLGRWRDDGVLEFLDRIDHQVKVRGFRIELREIEAALSTQAQVREAIVVSWENQPGDHSLVAYVIWDGEAADVSATLGGHLRDRLPEYMVPEAFVILESLPLLPNGKVDRRALPRPERIRRAEFSYVPPRDQVEERMVEIWEEVLGLRDVGVTADFFALGGHSLKAAALVNRLVARFDVEIPLSALFEDPTVAGLSQLVRRQIRGSAESAARAGSLVPMHLADSRLPPLFLAHPHGGEVFPYYALVRALGDQRSVYGLRSRGLDGTTEVLATRIEDMVSHYLDEIRRVRPHGPYHLAGWSFGGLVVYEMARRLEAVGEKVALLAILDIGPLEQPIRPRGEVTLAEVAELFFKIDRNAFTGLDRKQSLALILDQARGHPLLVEGTSPARLDTLMAVMEANTEALWRYRTAGRVAVDLHLFQATADSHLPDPRRWRPHTRGELHLVTIHGDHHSLMMPPAVAELAAGLNRALAARPASYGETRTDDPT